MIILILGPTASGKTALSVKVAKKINGEIIGADSVQIYKNLVIGAATPSIEEMGGIKHHLVGTHDLENEITAGTYIKLANKAIREIVSKGKVPVITGGTNFYVDALINGLSPVPDIDEKKRKKFNALLNIYSTEELYLKLLEIDPEWASKISSKNDIQRIKRGLEVAELTGKKLSDWNKMEKTYKYEGEFKAFVINIDRNELYDKINLRAEQMVKSGIIEEVENIHRLGFNSFNCKALNSIGYLETEKFLSGEIHSKEELVDIIAKNTRNLAKRQITWLKNRDYVTWMDKDTIIKKIQG